MKRGILVLIGGLILLALYITAASSDQMDSLTEKQQREVIARWQQ